MPLLQLFSGLACHYDRREVRGVHVICMILEIMESTRQNDVGRNSANTAENLMH